MLQAFIDYYLYPIMLIAPTLDVDKVREVLCAELSLLNKDGTFQLDFWMNNYIYKHSWTSPEDVDLVIHYQYIVEEFCGPFGHQKRKNKKARKNVTPEGYLNYFTMKIMRVTYYSYDLIRDVLIAAGKSHPELSKEVFFWPTDDQQRLYSTQRNNLLAALIAKETGHDAYKVSKVLRVNEVVHELCGEP